MIFLYQLTLLFSGLIINAAHFCISGNPNFYAAHKALKHKTIHSFQLHLKIPVFVTSKNTPS